MNALILLALAVALIAGLWTVRRKSLEEREEER